MKKILYVEDMEKCYLKTKEAFGEEYFIDWKKTEVEAFNAINDLVKNQLAYDAAIFDINLNQNPSIPLNKQTSEGLGLIKRLREKSEEILILCVSSNGKYKNQALKNGADAFFFKKEFWEEKGKRVLSEILNQKT